MAAAIMALMLGTLQNGTASQMELQKNDTVNTKLNNGQLRQQIMENISHALAVASVQIHGRGTKQDPRQIENCSMRQFIELQKDLPDGCAITVKEEGTVKIPNSFQTKQLSFD